MCCLPQHLLVVPSQLLRRLYVCVCVRARTRVYTCTGTDSEAPAGIHALALLCIRALALTRKPPLELSRMLYLQVGKGPLQHACSFASCLCLVWPCVCSLVFVALLGGVWPCACCLVEGCMAWYIGLVYWRRGRVGARGRVNVHGLRIGLVCVRRAGSTGGVQRAPRPVQPGHTRCAQALNERSSRYLDFCVLLRARVRA